MFQFLLILASVITAYVLTELLVSRLWKSTGDIFHVTATPETRAHMALWRQHEAQLVPDDLRVLTELEQWIEDRRIMQTREILVDFGSSTPEFHINEVGNKVPSKYLSFDRNGYRIFGMWAVWPDPLYDNVWECYIDCFEKL